jgi:hypothetical protein
VNEVAPDPTTAARCADLMAPSGKIIIKEVLCQKLS